MDYGLETLLNKKAFIFDVEGVLCDDIDRGKPLRSAVDFVNNLQKMGRTVAVLSNISRKPRAIVFSRLRAMGFTFSEHVVFTAGATAALYVRKHYPKAKCFVISEWGLRTDLEGHGVTLVNEGDADLVLIGVNRNATYAELNHAARLVLKGAKLICIGATMMFKGTFMGETGVYLGEAPFANAIAMATNAAITYIGKPYPEIFIQAISSVRVKKEEAVVIGDTLHTDIKGANAAGINSVYISKGIEFQKERVPKEDMPTFVAKDLVELNKMLFLR